MGREKLALFLAAVLIAVSAWNIQKADRLYRDINAQLYEVQEGAQAAAWSKAESAMLRAMEQWIKAESYTHIFIRHPEIDSCTDTFYEAYEAVLSKSRDELPARLNMLRYHLSSIASMERISLGNIF